MENNLEKNICIYMCIYIYRWGFPGGSNGKESTCNAEFDPWVGKMLQRREMATYSSILTWRIPWTEEPGRLYSPWGRRESDTTK